MRKFDYEFLIDNEPVLLPDSGVVIESDDVLASESGMDESGFMHVLVQRMGVRKFTLKYQFIDLEEYQYMESLFKNKATFTVETRNIYGEAETLECYRPSRPAPALKNRKTGKFEGYTLVAKEL